MAWLSEVGIWPKSASSEEVPLSERLGLDSALQSLQFRQNILPMLNHQI